MFRATVLRGQVDAELGVLKHFAEGGKKAIPILRNVCFEATDTGDLTGTCTNLVRRLTSPFEIEEVEGVGGITVPIDMLQKVFRAFETRTVVFEQAEDRRLLLRSGAREISLAGVPLDDFPVASEINPTVAFRCPLADFLQVLDRVIFCVSVEESRFQLAGALVEVLEDRFTMAATDGHRLSFATAAARVDLFEDAQPRIVNGAALREISRFRGRPGAEVLVEMGEEGARLTIGERVVVCRVHEGTFPDYRRVIPQDVDMPHAVRALAAPIVKSCGIAEKLDMGGMLLTLNSSIVIKGAKDGNEYRDEMPVTEPADEACTVCISSGYVLEAVRACGTPQVELRARDENTPLKIQPVASQLLEHVQVIMPMRYGAPLNQKPVPDQESEPEEGEPAEEEGSDDV